MNTDKKTQIDNIRNKLLELCSIIVKLQDEHKERTMEYTNLKNKLRELTGENSDESENELSDVDVNENNEDVIELDENETNVIET
jgi:hypothetical protein